MSDVKPATDYEISGIKAAMPDHFYQKHRMLADMGLLLARIAADAARIRELEAALGFYADASNWQRHYPPGTSSLAMMKDPVSTAIAADGGEKARAMLAAAPRP